ncbi:E3 ubiquitin-protein ligase UPL5-like isoform X2 [Cynara cardunculus var. scolymus]|uniref:E3 ubiquitin-protein ligase UPL5-like isoform X2 n=1 Tax=Cynara cardunculus var. scolymus TaxID=59895 RepID=UPI000D624B2C|nr:E3 ubiquitin-protein ligase UPL5-like isoform X2 [Cynara cardunculus var. scolymus]
MLFRGEPEASTEFVKIELMEFLSMIPENQINHAAVKDHLHIFTSSCVLEALVMLYMSSDKRNKDCAKESIQEFITSIRFMLPQPVSSQFVPLVLELCKMLQSAAGYDDSLYKLCRGSLGVMVKNAKNYHSGDDDDDDNKVIISLQDMFPFAAELANKLSRGLVSSVESPSNFGPLRGDVNDFMAFMKPLKTAVKYQVVSPRPMLPSNSKFTDAINKAAVKYQVGSPRPILPPNSKFTDAINKIKFLYVLFDGLLTTLVACLKKMEVLVIEKKENGGWDQYLVILKELHDISKLYRGGEEYFWTNLKDFKRSLCHLIVRYAIRDEDYGWILQQKDAINFESRRHLVMLLFPVVMDENDDIHEMLINRTQLLAESFVYIAHEDPDRLRSGLFMEFKDEEATGPGVLREWFFLLSQEIFNPKTGLFVACPNDPRRFFPNPASRADPLDLEYFNFAGRVIALALMNRVPVGIVFDRSFFLQLAGKNVSLEDIKDVDPFLYSSCRKILDMDPLAVDEDALGLTFVWNVDKLGAMDVVELCPGGKNMIVNSKNRKTYVDLLIHHCFVVSVAEQISHFARGFTDIVGGENILKMFFSSLTLEDFDKMLHGSETDISVVDWKAHTDYEGYSPTDPQIYWFWKIVEEMTGEQRKVLLFFWISMKYLPVEGFGGLTSRLYIYKSKESFDHLPSSHTCFYQICLPAYPSMDVMKNRLNVITQHHVGCSFGTS